MLTFACSQYDENFHGSGGVLAAVLHECGMLGGPPIYPYQEDGFVLVERGPC